MPLGKIMNVCCKHPRAVGVAWYRYLGHSKTNGEEASVSSHGLKLSLLAQNPSFTGAQEPLDISIMLPGMLGAHDHFLFEHLGRRNSFKDKDETQLR